MTKKYLLAEQTISPAELAELAAWLTTNPWLTQGPLVREFETRWARWLGTKHAVLVNSGSSANLLMYYALLAGTNLRNRKVIVPAVSWATTVAPAIQLGFEPILCEADAATFGLDLDHLEKLLEEHHPAAVILVHVLGVPNDMQAVMSLKDRFDFTLMEDCCAAHGSRFDGQKVGTFGELSSFSFYYGHHMSTIEGGIVCTSDAGLNDTLLQLRSHGWAKDLSAEKEAELVAHYQPIDFNRTFTFYLPGFNVRSTDLNAKIGLMQMDRLDAMIERRIENHRVYQQRIGTAPGFACQSNERAAISSISFGALCSSVPHRARVAAALREAGIETRPLGGGNMSRQPFWRERYDTIPLPMADRIHQTSLQLPNHHLLSVSDVNHICDVVTGVKVEETRKLQTV
jgi:CDP-6-deoxy-D-xylo-4-hexulose-3-dehydrase